MSEFGREDPRNAGVVSDEYVGPGSGAGGRPPRAMLRRVTYTDPVDKTTYVSLTTEMTLPPGILALIYKQRRDVEKTFNELKSKLVEKKGMGQQPDSEINPGDVPRPHTKSDGSAGGRPP